MKKIKSLFVRDYDRGGLAINEVLPGSEWVMAGEGVAYRKWDGTCCLIRDGVLFKRHDRKISRKRGVLGERKPAPEGWEPCEVGPDPHTDHWPGWVPVGDVPGDKWHRVGLKEAIEVDPAGPADGTYELCGPKVQGNPEGLVRHVLVRHTSEVSSPPRDFDSLREFFKVYNIEGVVWHHPDGRMVKVKGSDFGIPRPKGIRLRESE